MLKNVFCTRVKGGERKREVERTPLTEGLAIVLMVRAYFVHVTPEHVFVSFFFEDNRESLSLNTSQVPNREGGSFLID